MGRHSCFPDLFWQVGEIGGRLCHLKNWKIGCISNCTSSVFVWVKERERQNERQRRRDWGHELDGPAFSFCVYLHQFHILIPLLCILGFSYEAFWSFVLVCTVNDIHGKGQVLRRQHNFPKRASGLLDFCFLKKQQEFLSLIFSCTLNNPTVSDGKFEASFSHMQVSTKCIAIAI